MTGQYSDIKSDGGMDPRNSADEAAYWRRRYESLLEDIVRVSVAYEAGLVKGRKEGAAAERNRVWTQSDWTDYERDIAAAEREACAKVCEDKAAEWANGEVVGRWQAECAAAIRARGQQ